MWHSQGVQVHREFPGFAALVSEPGIMADMGWPTLGETHFVEIKIVTESTLYTEVKVEPTPGNAFTSF